MLPASYSSPCPYPPTPFSGTLRYCSNLYHQFLEESQDKSPEFQIDNDPQCLMSDWNPEQKIIMTSLLINERPGLVKIDQ